MAAGDLLFVRDGTYLVGSVAIVSEYDIPFLFQSHVVRFRAREAELDPFLLMAALSTPIVKRQVRAKQFTADIIDTIGARYRELWLPLPKGIAARSATAGSVRAAVQERAGLLQTLRFAPYWIEGLVPPGEAHRDTREPDLPSAGFLISTEQIGRGPLIPRFYSPGVAGRLAALRRTHELISVGELVSEKQLSWKTGIEVGKLAYGGEGPPFVRTSDFSSWELKVDPKQRVSVETYERYMGKQDVIPDDVFVVRDGTYLVGSSAIVTQADCPLLFSGGIYRLRAAGGLDPYLLLTLLNAPIVREQMRAMQFTRDVIDTLGKRLFDVLLPFPKDKELSGWVADEVRKAVTRRVELRTAIRECVLSLEGDDVTFAEEADLVDEGM